MNVSKSIGYTPQDFPAGTVLAYAFQLMGADGNPVGAVQTFADPPKSVTVSAVPGVYTLVGTQKDANGNPVGVAVSSAPFELLADVSLPVISSIG